MIQVKCSGCQKQYSVPAEKIPEGKVLDLPCPACKTIIKLRRPPKEAQVEVSPIQGNDAGHAAGLSKTPKLSAEITCSGEVECPYCKKTIIIRKTEEKAQTQPDEPLPPPPEGGQELMKKIIRISKALPPMPEVMAKATEVLSSDRSDFNDVAHVLEADQAMATRVLKLANSAYYALANPVSSVQQASALLGFQTLLELITVVSTSKMMGKRLAGYDIDSKEVWRHSLAVAVGAKIIAQKKFPRLVNDAFNAGLIHDSGMVIMDDHVTAQQERFNAVLEKGKTIQEAERVVFGFDHGEIASEFFLKWKLPPAQTHAIRFHHNPSASENDILSYILHVSDAMDNRLNTGKKVDLDPKALETVYLTEEDLEYLGEDTREAVMHIMETMG